jgi:hypothetical protein
LLFISSHFSRARTPPLPAQLSTADQRRWDDLQAFTSSTGNFGAYRAAFGAAAAAAQRRIPQMRHVCAADERQSIALTNSGKYADRDCIFHHSQNRPFSGRESAVLFLCLEAN